jgi:apolipoprotein N-acyltransferase
MRRLRAESLRAEADGAEVVIWPEAGTYPYAWTRPVERDSERPRSRVNIERTTPTLLGVITLERDSPFPYNSIVYLTPQGDVRGVFDKVELLVFGERVPFVDVEWAKLYLPNVAQLSPGAGPVRFDVELADLRRVSVGPLVCFEDIIAHFAHRVAAQNGGIQLFVNTTIDAWYGDSKEPWEHLALTQFRSVEHRIPLVRSVSTGVSAVIDATGRQQAVLPPRITPPGATPRFESEVLVSSVALPRNTQERPTFFARVGWIYPWLCSVACVLLVLAFRLRRAQPAADPSR